MYIDWKLMNDKYYDKLIQTHKNDTDFFITSSGLSYKLIHKGETMWKPNPNDWVRVNYTGKLIDGSVFGSGAPDTLYLPNTVAGWREILPKFATGTKLTLYVPSTLGYDTLSTNSLLPPHSVLIFDIELLARP
jgi:peptidylprolyl isomerase